MKAIELENWTLDIVARVNARQPIEDSRVEVKREWPADHAKAARRLAGHCNASRGEPALWIIGLDETEGVVGAEMTKIPDWLDQVRSCFEGGLAPALVRDVNVPTDEKTLVALLFDTNRAPYVVKNPEGRIPEREVPWREGTAVRSAKREDLIRLLVPMSRLPKIEVLDARAEPGKLKVHGAETFQHVLFQATLYVHHADDKRLCLPFHQCSGELSHAEAAAPVPLSLIDLRPPSSSETMHSRGFASHGSPKTSRSLTMDATASELLIDGPGRVNVTGLCPFPVERGADCGWVQLRFSVSLQPSGADRTVVVSGILHREEHVEKAGKWLWSLKPANT